MAFSCRRVFGGFWELCKKYKLITYSGLIIVGASNFTLRNEVKTLTERVAVLQQTNEDLLHDMILYNRSYEEFPAPVWNKVKRGYAFIAQYFNPAYEDVFLTPLNFNRYDKIGKTDFDNFDYKTAIVYFNRDLQMALNGGSEMFEEDYVDSLGVRRKITVLKWRVIERKDTLIYGMVLPKKN